MALLEEALKFRQATEAQENASLDAMPEALKSFVAGQQMRRQSMLDLFKVDADLAAKGLKRDASGNIIRDPSIADPLSGWKAADYASKVGYRSMLGGILQGATGGAPSAPGAPPAAGGPPLPSGVSVPGQPGFGTFLKGFSINGPQIGMDTPQDQANRASGLRKELMDSTIVQSYRDLSKFSSRLDAALEAGQGSVSKSMSDQALITLFNKMLDEGSVVRESEYARTSTGLSALNRVQGFLEKLSKGGAGITNQERYDIIKVSKSLLDAAGDSYDSELDRFGQLAESDQYRVDRKSVLGGLQYKTPRFATEAEAEAAGLKDGQKIKIGDKIAIYHAPKGE